VAALLAFPAALTLVGLYVISDRPAEWRPGAPLLLIVFYSIVTGMLGRTITEVDERGFRTRPGPLPAFVRGEDHGKDNVKELFPRYLREYIARGVHEDRYYACAELANGRWVNILGPYPDWAGASEACQRIAALWRPPVIGAGRSGFPPGFRDWRTLSVYLCWLLAYAAALAWAVFQTIRPN
jgi:hypothetical protein